MALRLDPRIPIVWRSTSSVQVGGLTPIAVFPGVSHDDELLLSALRSGTTREGLDGIARVGRMRRGAVDDLLARLGDALESPARPRPAALIVGDGDLALRLDAALRAAGREPRPGGTGLVVLVAPWTVLPADAGVWLRRDVPHLPVVLGESSATVGPLVRPGEGPCLHCVDRHRLDDDPSWAAVAAQLLGLPAPALGPLATAHALSLAGRIVIGALDGSVGPGVEWRLDTRTGAITERVWARHPECRCAPPPGSDWARASAPAPDPSASGTSAARAAIAPA